MLEKMNIHVIGPYVYVDYEQHLDNIETISEKKGEFFDLWFNVPVNKFSVRITSSRV